MGVVICLWHRLFLLECLNFLNFAEIGKRIEAARSVAEGNEGYRTAESLAAFYAVSPDSLKKNYCCVSDKSSFLL